MSHFNSDPILAIRKAVATALRACHVSIDHKTITDTVIDELPDFFRGELADAEFIKQVEETRSSQIQYFRERTPSNLSVAKASESKLDKMFADRGNRQTELF